MQQAAFDLGAHKCRADDRPRHVSQRICRVTRFGVPHRRSMVPPLFHDSLCIWSFLQEMCTLIVGSFPEVCSGGVWRAHGRSPLPSNRALAQLSLAQNGGTNVKALSFCLCCLLH